MVNLRVAPLLRSFCVPMMSLRVSPNSASSDYAAPISVTAGSTDGKLTEIRSGQVKPGMPLIVEVLKEGK
jgi:multidrug efflux pump subunit AcrA (membrane-fusion protein)